MQEYRAALITAAVVGKIDVRSIQPAADRREIQILQHAISKLLVLRPRPRGVEKESKGESGHPDLYLQTSGFGGIGAIVAANRVSRDLHVRPNVAGLGIPQMAQRTDSEDLGV